MIYYLFIIPFRICFISIYVHSDDEHITQAPIHYTIWIDLIVDLLFVIDIFLRFLYFSYYDGDTIETKSYYISKNYFYDTFLYDVLGTFIFDYLLLLNNDYVWILYWLRLLRLFRLHRSSEYITLAENFVQDHIVKNAVYIHMIQQFFVIAVCSHWFCCIWYLIGVSDDSQHSWLAHPEAPVYNQMSNTTDISYL
jgi:hypothetical protein